MASLLDAAQNTQSLSLLCGENIQPRPAHVGKGTILPHWVVLLKLLSAVYDNNLADNDLQSVVVH